MLQSCLRLILEEKEVLYLASFYCTCFLKMQQRYHQYRRILTSAINIFSIYYHIPYGNQQNKITIIYF